MRCANSEALARYERETNKNEKIYEQNCENMFAELDEALEMISEIGKRYGLESESVEYVKDMI